MMMIAGDQTLPTSGVFKAMIGGDARVVSGSDLHLKGMIGGDLIIEAGSRVTVSAMVGGDVINEGSDVKMKGLTA